MFKKCDAYLRAEGKHCQQLEVITNQIKLAIIIYINQLAGYRTVLVDCRDRWEQ